MITYNIAPKIWGKTTICYKLFSQKCQDNNIILMVLNHNFRKRIIRHYNTTHDMSRNIICSPFHLRGRYSDLLIIDDYDAFSPDIKKEMYGLRIKNIIIFSSVNISNSTIEKIRTIRKNNHSSNYNSIFPYEKTLLNYDFVTDPNTEIIYHPKINLWNFCNDIDTKGIEI